MNMKEKYLVSSLVTDKDNKRAVIFVDIVIDESWYPRI